MQEFKLKNAETGEIYSFFGRVIAERSRAVLQDEEGAFLSFGDVRIFETQDLPAQPRYLVAIQVDDEGGFDLEFIRDAYVMCRYGEFVVKTPEHLLHSIIMSLLRDAGANAIELHEVVLKVAEARAEFRAYPPPPKPQKRTVAKGHFENFRSEHFDDPAFSHPTI